MSGRRLAGLFGVIVLTVVAVAGSWGVYRARTPRYAIERAIEAIRTRDAVAFATYIDVERIAAHFVEELFEEGLREAVSSPDDMVFVGFAAAMAEKLKSAARSEIVVSVDGWIRTGELREPPEDSPAAVLFDFPSTFPLEGYKGPSGQRYVDGGVLVGLEFHYGDLDTTLVLDVRLEKIGKTWRVVALDNLLAYGLGLDAVKDLRVAEVNRPTIERLSEKIEIGELHRKSSPQIWSMSEVVELGLPVTNRSGRPMAAVVLKGTYTVRGEERTIVFETDPAAVIGPGERAFAVHRLEYRPMFASPADVALARADAAALRLQAVPVHAMFRDGEKADTVRVYNSWNAYRARNNG